MERPRQTVPAGKLDRRTALGLAAGGAVVALGGWLFRQAGSRQEAAARAQTRPDGRPRLPPGQHLLTALKPMGGAPGDPDPAKFRLSVGGKVRKPMQLDYSLLLALPQTDLVCDVHCVTTWSCFDVAWRGVRLTEIMELAGVRDTARHVIFEAPGGYTANIPIEEALKPNVMVAYRMFGDPLPLENGPPVRALVPDLYFWKSAKWLTGIRFLEQDEPGYWETRGYHNHGDPWLEERYG